MKRRRVVIALWLAFAFVTWNVAFDRAVSIAAVEFTRNQIAKYQQGTPVDFIEDAFSPRVGAAALEASLYAGVVLALGGMVALRSPRNPNPQSSRNPRVRQ